MTKLKSKETTRKIIQANSAKLVFPLAFIIALLSTPSFAAISVETFTCSGQSGTAAVENGAAFSCQASLRNEDTQNSANVATVTLLVNGNWAEQTSYAGSGFSTSIGAGASTTAIFSGIRSVTPGATNRFQSIQIDSASDTFVTNTNINAITIKSLTVTASESSASQSGQFDVSATVIAGGDLGSVDMTWSASGGCSLVSGHTTTKSVGSLAHNAEATRTWRVSQGSSDCVSTVTASGTSSSVTTSKSKSVTVSYTASAAAAAAGTGGGGGGGAGGVAAAKGETKSVKQILPGKAAVLGFTKSAVSSIVLDVVQTASNVSVTIEEVSTPAVPAPGQNVYKYLDIKAVNISEANIKSGTITFAVSKAWLTGKDRGSVRLMRYANAWQELATTLKGESANDVAYSATTPGFSVFAITATPQAEQKPDVCPQVITPATDGRACREFPTPCDVPQGWTAVDKCPEEVETVPVQVPGIGEITLPKPLVDYGPIILVVVVIVIVVLGWFHYHGPGKKMKKLTYEFRPQK